jgi:hypothetical protein
VIPFLLVCGCLSFNVAWAGPCVAGSLTAYDNLGAAGCNVGALRYFNFQFGTNTGESSDNILVTPNGSLTSPGFAFSGFIDLNASNNFTINYTIDPPPIIVRQIDSLDPPFGNDVATQLICVNQLFGGGANCADSSAPFSLSVDNTNPPASWSGTLQFGGLESMLDVRTTITLGGSNNSGIDDFVTHTDVTPEPATLALTGVALLALAAWKRHAFSKPFSRY